MRGVLAIAIFCVALFATVNTVGAQSVECTICEYITQYAEQYISSSSTEAEVEALLDEACNLLGPLSSECSALVNTYLPELVQLLIQDEPPQVICEQVNLC
eukprot:TRINITY_DN599_c0_g1_i2.p1 TRINITY_DN599_c0_g1~~TRINITY_DN599_c0_g1_i2.p1  ORF type:complete len:101 (+),score=20.04 TRINITY_DN599_c0_g1_i2:75-377(+)